jgi:hypothetical protein
LNPFKNASSLIIDIKVLDPGGDAVFHHDALEADFDGFGGDVEAFGDLAVGVSQTS